MKNGSKLGENFRKSVLKMVLTYMMKFGGDEEGIYMCIGTQKIRTAKK